MYSQNMASYQEKLKMVQGHKTNMKLKNKTNKSNLARKKKHIVITSHFFKMNAVEPSKQFRENREED